MVMLKIRLKLLQKEQLKNRRGSWFFDCIKIVDKITKVSRTSPQDSLGTVKIETGNIGSDGEIPKERYISTEIITDNLRIIS